MVEEKEIERLFTIPLRKAKHGPSSRAAPAAVKSVRQYLMKHMKVENDNIWIDESLNHALWAQGKTKIPSKIRIRAVKFDDGVVEASLPELGTKTSRRELLKEEKEKKTPILRRPEDVEEEGEEETGAEDYEIAPTGDGEVKIKKKKPVKKEETTEDKEPVKTEKKTSAKKTTKKQEKSKKSSEKPAEKKKSNKKASSTKTKKPTSKKTNKKPKEKQ